MNGVPSILDPHVHHWDLRRTPREASTFVKLLGWAPQTMGWLAPRLFPADVAEFFGAPDHLLADYLVDQTQADADGYELEGYVHVEAGWKGKGPLGPVAETEWLERTGTPLLKAIVGFADLSLGSDVDAVLAAHTAASPRFRGIRYALSHHPNPRIMNGCDRPGLASDGNWRAGYARLAEHGLSFDATIYHHQLDEVVSLARDFPEIPIVLCHAATPVAAGGPFGGLGASKGERDAVVSAWRDGMSELAEQPNVTVKISGLVMPIVGWDFHAGSQKPNASVVADSLEPFVAFIVDTFGAQRCMFASNFPVDKVSASWSTLFDAFSRTVAGRSEAERELLFAGTARRAYRL